MYQLKGTILCLKSVCQYSKSNRATDTDTVNFILLVKFPFRHFGENLKYLKEYAMYAAAIKWKDKLWLQFCCCVSSQGFS